MRGRARRRARRRPRRTRALRTGAARAERARGRPAARAMVLTRSSTSVDSSMDALPAVDAGHARQDLDAGGDPALDQRACDPAARPRRPARWRRRRRRRRRCGARASMAPRAYRARKGAAKSAECGIPARALGVRTLPRLFPAENHRVLTRLVLATLPYVPSPIMRRIAARYIAGRDAARSAGAARGARARAGTPGSSTSWARTIARRARGARASPTTYVRGGRRRSRSASSTATSRSSPRTSACDSPRTWRCELYARLARTCARLGLFLRVEMEDHPTTDATLRVFERLRAACTRTSASCCSRASSARSTTSTRSRPGRSTCAWSRASTSSRRRSRTPSPSRIREAYVAVRREARRARRAHRRSRRTTSDLAERVHRPCCARAGTRAGARTSSRCCWACARSCGSAGSRPATACACTCRTVRSGSAYSLRRMSKNPQIVGHVVRDMLAPSSAARAERGSLADREPPREHFRQHAGLQDLLASSRGSRTRRGATSPTRPRAPRSTRGCRRRAAGRPSRR